MIIEKFTTRPVVAQVIFLIFSFVASENMLFHYELMGAIVTFIRLAKIKVD